MLMQVAIIEMWKIQPLKARRAPIAIGQPTFCDTLVITIYTNEVKCFFRYSRGFLSHLFTTTTYSIVCLLNVHYRWGTWWSKSIGS